MREGIDEYAGSIRDKLKALLPQRHTETKAAKALRLLHSKAIEILDCKVFTQIKENVDFIVDFLEKNIPGLPTTIPSPDFARLKATRKIQLILGDARKMKETCEKILKPWEEKKSWFTALKDGEIKHKGFSVWDELAAKFPIRASHLVLLEQIITQLDQDETNIEEKIQVINEAISALSQLIENEYKWLLPGMSYFSHAEDSYVYQQIPKEFKDIVGRQYGALQRFIRALTPTEAKDLAPAEAIKLHPLYNPASPEFLGNFLELVKPLGSQATFFKRSTEPVDETPSVELKESITPQDQGSAQEQEAEAPAAAI